jgi:outer membrane protein
MKKYLLIFFFLIPTISFAENIAIVDITYLLTNSKIGKVSNSNLEKSSKAISENFKKQEENFKEKEKKIISKKNILSKEEFENEVKKLTKDISKYRNDKKKTLNEFKIKKDKEYAKLYKRINDILINYSKENNIKTVIDKRYVLISKSETDITKQILKILDK